ncbi:MAG: hypothetical protein JW863_10160 [Chitinispirillaceae bacterium]|nr:hypothetical protein [Chitinispirillaceae bacterium]
MPYFHRIRLWIQLFLLLVITAILLLSGCTGSELTGQQESVVSGGGAATIDIRVGKVGVLAKRTAIEMEYLIIKIIRASDDSVIITDTSDLSGHGETAVSKTFTDLSAPETYTLAATAIDEEGKEIHSGSTDFATIPADTVDVSLDLDARYSMLLVSFNEIPDSVNAVSLGIEDVATLDSSFTFGSRNSISLTYDYLAANINGIEYDISLRARGSFYGTDTVLYAADTTVVARSGLDTSYQIVLKWVGPDIPDGAAEFTVTIGTVGTTVINTDFTEMGGLSDLVDDLEDGDELTRYLTYWFSYCDQDSGGNSTITPQRTVEGYPFTPVSSGARNSKYAASFTYVLNQGSYQYQPYAGIGFNLDIISGWDISAATGIRFYYKGSSSRVRIGSSNITDFGWWGYDVPASTDWKLVNLVWSQFNQPEWAEIMPFDRTAVLHITFEVLGETGDAGTVWVDDIHLPGFLR